MRLGRSRGRTDWTAFGIDGACEAPMRGPPAFQSTLVTSGWGAEPRRPLPLPRWRQRLSSQICRQRGARVLAVALAPPDKRRLDAPAQQIIVAMSHRLLQRLEPGLARSKGAPCLTEEPGKGRACTTLLLGVEVVRLGQTSSPVTRRHPIPQSSSPHSATRPDAASRSFVGSLGHSNHGSVDLFDVRTIVEVK